MKISLPWLKELLPTQLSLEKVAETLTVIGLEVEHFDAKNEVLEVALTPNLAHCASVRGVARELAAVTQEKLNKVKSSLIEKGDEAIDTRTSVTVENTGACPRYACRLITGVKVGPSPDWLKERLELCGMRSVNNVVDVTNLVLLELGHPLHPFDFETLADKKLVIRNAKKGEKITTLDGKEYFPTEEMLMICDAEKPVAIAGVMGAAHSEVTEGTTTILLESAYFEPTQVRRTAKHLGIHTEASYRFERGTDPNGVCEALDRATAYLCEIAGGTALQGALDVHEGDFPTSTVSCRISRVNQVLGTQLANGEVETILTRLNLHVLANAEGTLTVEVPTYRHDIQQEIDLIEEVARLYGYDNIHTTQAATYRTGSLPHAPAYLFERDMRHYLLNEGLQELLTCDLISPEQSELVAPDGMPSRALIKLLNPHSEAQSVLRPSLLPGLLSVVKLNSDHGIHALAGFEVGRLHFTSKERYLEPTVASIVLTGSRAPHHWDKGELPVDFYDLKGIVENVLEKLRCEGVMFSPTSYENFHPGRQAAVMQGEVELGIIGEVHPATLKKLHLEHPVYFAELNLDDLKQASTPKVKMTPLPQYPSSSRDITLTLAESTQVGALIGKIWGTASPLLESVLVLDIYRSAALGAQKKNVSFRFVYRDRAGTLSVDAVEAEHTKITQKLKEHEDLS